MVLDTGVVVRALMGSTEAASYRVVEAAGLNEVRPALSDRGLQELSRIVGEQEERIGAARAFRVTLDLLTHGTLYRPARLEWPSVSDTDDWWLLDLAYEAEADYIVAWDQHLTRADLPLPIEVLTPDQLLARL